MITAYVIRFIRNKYSNSFKSLNWDFYRSSIFFDMALSVLWQSIARKQLMYERICESLFLGDGGSKTVAERITVKVSAANKINQLQIYCKVD